MRQGVTRSLLAIKVINNVWSSLPDLPEDAAHITHCVSVPLRSDHRCIEAAFALLKIHETTPELGASLTPPWL